MKLLLHALHENELPFLNGGEPFDVPEIPTLTSLGAIVAILSVTAIISLVVSGRRQRKGLTPQGDRIPDAQYPGDADS